MKYIKTMTQQRLSFLLALYIGLFMNAAVFIRRFDGYAQEFTVWKGLAAIVEVAGTVLVTFFYFDFSLYLDDVRGACCRRWWCCFPQVPVIT